MQSLPRVVPVIVESNDSVLLFEFVPYDRLVPAVGFNVVLRFSPVIVFISFAALLTSILSVVATDEITSVFFYQNSHRFQFDCQLWLIQFPHPLPKMVYPH